MTDTRKLIIGQSIKIAKNKTNKKPSMKSIKQENKYDFLHYVSGKIEGIYKNYFIVNTGKYKVCFLHKDIKNNEYRIV